MLKNKAINKIEEGLKNSSSTTHGLERMSHTRLDENKKAQQTIHYPPKKWHLMPFIKFSVIKKLESKFFYFKNLKFNLFSLKNTKMTFIRTFIDLFPTLKNNLISQNQIET
jgi:hypothetical protein